MKSPTVYFGSDLHLEFKGHNFEIPSGDILLLAGDIFTPNNILDHEPARNSHLFFKEVNQKFKHVYIVMGNHEHYHGYLVETRDIAEDMIEPYSNIKILDGESVIHDDIAIFGGTLWTNFDDYNPISMFDAKQGMSDYDLIGYSPERININTMMPGKLDPDDLFTENQNYRSLINKFLESTTDYKQIVVTHHAPSYACCPEMYRGDSLNGSYFNTKLDHHFDRNITWIHGHVHTRYEMEYGEGRILANPRGYPSEIREEYSLKRLDI
jgi:Icc-related predicted phosphoesterase